MAKGNSDFTIGSLRGGLNNTDPSFAIANDQCVVAENVEFFQSTIGERRNGCVPMDITGSNLDSENDIVFLGGHIPAEEVFQSPLECLLETNIWAVAVTEDVSSTIAYRDEEGIWSEVTPVDDIIPSYPEANQIYGQSIHGKFFISYKSDVDRLHVWDGTTLRRTGLAAPITAPTVVNTVPGGSYVGDRTFRVRFIEKDGSTILRRSEPSDEITFSPSGANTGAVISRPALVNEGETDWELEASNGDGNFYRIATIPVATISYTDTTQPANNYALDGVLSADIGDYDLIPSVKYIVADEDRLIFGSEWENVEHTSRISWTPVWAAPGVGNDERIPITTDNYFDLDWLDGGYLTGLSHPLNGSFYAFKLNKIYKVQRTGDVNNAYQAFLLYSSKGALPGSIINGQDEYGQGCVYFLDPYFGPCRISTGGLQNMKDIRGTWGTVNTAATNVACHGVYYPNKQQVHWWVATGNSDTPTLKIISQTTEIKSSQDGGGGTNRGWTTANGKIAQAWCSMLLPEAIPDTDGSISLIYRPLIGLPFPSFIQRTDLGATDDTTKYIARIVTKPYILSSLIDKFGAMNATLLARAETDPTAAVAVNLIRDFGMETNGTQTNLFQQEDETCVIKQFDNLVMSNTTALQVELTDPSV